jgi:hypothetical protein
MRKLFFAICLLAASGCSSRLDTGYEPKRLDMPLSREETLYADPYSQQAMQAQQEDNSQSGESVAHRPGQTN